MTYEEIYPRKGRIILILDKLGLLDLLARLRVRDIIAIILYHEIGERNIYWEKGIPLRLFKAQIEYLVRLGFKFMTIGDVVELMESGSKELGKIAVLTFDDGYKGVYMSAYPIMRKIGIAGTVFVPGGLIEHKTPIWSSAMSYALRKIKTPVEIEFGEQKIEIRREIEKESIIGYLLHKLPQMSIHELIKFIYVLFEYLGEKPEDLYHEIMIDSEELGELADYGFEIGAHGYWHLGLPFLNDKQLEDEILNAKQFTRTYSDTRPLSFAYPYGLYTVRVIEKLKKYGFHSAVTVNPRCIRKYSINRYELGRISATRFGLIDLVALKYQLIV